MLILSHVKTEGKAENQKEEIKIIKTHQRQDK